MLRASFTHSGRTPEREPYRLYTSAIRVTSDARASAPANAVVREIKGAELGILFDPLSVDESTGIITAPLRVQNLTGDSLYGPLIGTSGVIPAGATTGQFTLRIKPQTPTGSIGRLTATLIAMTARK